MFKKGDKVKCINAGSIRDTWAAAHLTQDKEYEVSADQCDNDNVNVINNQGRSQGYYPDRFELARRFPVLKPGMRVVFASSEASGGAGVVVRNARDELGVSCNLGGWVDVYFAANGRFDKDYNIVEVYEAPNFWDAKDPNERGVLVWKSEDAVKAAAIKSADVAVAEAEAALEAAKAARAAL